MLSDCRFAPESCHVASEVDPDPDEGDHEDRPSVRRRRRDETANGAVDDQAGEDEQRRAVRLRGEDLRAAEPERAVPARRLRREPQHDERHHERARVGEHVRRVGEERERVREDAGDDLADHEGDDQRERNGQAASVVAASVRVTVRVVVHDANHAAGLITSFASFLPHSAARSSSPCFERAGRALHEEALAAR